VRKISVGETWQMIDDPSLDRIEGIERAVIAKPDTAITSWPNIQQRLGCLRCEEWVGCTDRMPSEPLPERPSPHGAIRRNSHAAPSRVLFGIACQLFPLRGTKTVLLCTVWVQSPRMLNFGLHLESRSQLMDISREQL
jgi:hypothetical protein